MDINGHRSSGPRGRILVVEDNDLERHTLMTLLSAEQYEPLGAGDAQQALAYVHQDVDVVLSDLRMHGRSGVDLLREWKARRPSTPFIFVTGVVDIAQVVEAVKLGAEDYITKPFRIDELLSRIAECIDAAREQSAYSEAAGGFATASNGYEDQLDAPASATMEEIERIAIETALRRHSGNRTHAAESLGISVRTLQRKLKAWAAASS
jgi:DNA-binding NtrC family response regulator